MSPLGRLRRHRDARPTSPRHTPLPTAEFLPFYAVHSARFSSRDSYSVRASSNPVRPRIP
jgi:hypothetical protein